MPTIVAKDSSLLRKDKKLKSLLHNVDSIETIEEFNQWRKSFLRVYTQYLDKEEAENAELACAKLSTSSSSLKKVVKKLADYIDKGSLSQDRITVRAKTCLSELKAKLTKLVARIVNLLPSTEKEIQAFGFSKWHMGAVLVHDGFKEYAVLMHCLALLRQMRVVVLDDVADRQVLDEIEYFEKKFKVLCGVLADLGLMPACHKATEVLYPKLLQEARQAETIAKKLEREKLSMSRHSSTAPKKKLDAARYAAFNGSNDHVNNDDEESSYEYFDEVRTVSSYETVEMSDDSSYETLEVEAETVYVTDEEEIEVSEYETDSDSDSDHQVITQKLRRRNNRKKLAGRVSKSHNKNKNTSTARSSCENDKKCCAPKRSTLHGRAGCCNSDNDIKGEEQAEKRPDEEESEQEEESHDESESDDSSSSSDDTPPPKKYGRTKPWPKAEPNPDPNYDPYAPTERIRWTQKDYYYNYNENLFKNRPSKRNEGVIDPPKEKKLRRVVHTETVTTHRKLAKPPPTRIRVKKEKPPIKRRVRREKKIIKRRRVKKNKGDNDAVPTNIIVVKENPRPLLSPMKSSILRSNEAAGSWPLVSPKKSKANKMGDSLTTMETMESSCTSFSSLNVH